MFEGKVKETLHKKQNDLIMHHVKLKEEKKDFNSSINEQIKECSIKIECLAKALNSGKKDFLMGAFNSYEVESFFR